MRNIRTNSSKTIPSFHHGTGGAGAAMSRIEGMHATNVNFKLKS